jgi:hypothetical protein
VERFYWITASGLRRKNWRIGMLRINSPVTGQLWSATCTAAKASQLRIAYRN